MAPSCSLFQDRCIMHGKRYLGFVCIETQCENKEKRGCNLCFMKNGKHQDHTFLQSQEIIEEINEFQIQEVLNRVKQKAKNTIVKINQELDEWYLKVVQKCEEIETKYEFIDNVDSLIEIYNIKKNEQILPMYQGIDIYQDNVIKNMKNAYSYIDSYYNKKYLEQISKYSKQIQELKNMYQEIYLQNPLRDFANQPFNFDMEEFENDLDCYLYPTVDQIRNYDSKGNPVFKIDNSLNGRIFYLNETGECYEGYMLNNQKHGKGKLINQYGHVYFGEFNQGQKHGQGIYMFGQYKYEGEFINNKYHGYGKMNYQNGDIFEGNYQFGMRHGKGKFIYKTGKTKIGIWSDDNFISDDTNQKNENEIYKKL